MKKFTLLQILTKLTLFTCLFSNAQAEIIGGVDFPEGEISFADAVVSYSPGSDVGSNATRNWSNPEAALGVPDDDGIKEESVVSLGDSGVLILQFIDNSLTTSGDDNPDLHIFEVGAVVERMNVAISTNNIDWIDIGFWEGQPASINIDGVSGVIASELYSYIRLTDDPSRNQTGFPFGEADIDAVGAISSGAAVVPIPAAMWLFISGIVGLMWKGHRARKLQA